MLTNRSLSASISLMAETKRYSGKRYIAVYLAYIQVKNALSKTFLPQY